MNLKNSFFSPLTYFFPVLFGFFMAVTMFLPLQLFNSIVCCPLAFMLKNRYCLQPCSAIVKGYHCVTKTPTIVYPEPYYFLEKLCRKNPSPSKTWQKERKDRLTASTFGGAIGLWRERRVQLWLEKLGAKEPFIGNLATHWKHKYKIEALERYTWLTGNEVDNTSLECQVYNTRENEDWLVVSPDGLIVKSKHGSSLNGVLQIKCPYFEDMRRATPWESVHLHHIPQAQGLMEILGCDWMDFYVWTRKCNGSSKGSNLFRLYRDVEYCGLLKKALSDFWFNHVQPAKLLCDRHGITNHCRELSSYLPEPNHELCDTNIDRSLLKKALSDFWFNNVPSAQLLCDRHAITNHCSELSSYLPEPKHELCETIIDRSMQIADRSELLASEVDRVFKIDEYYLPNSDII